MPTIFIENKNKLPERKEYDYYPTPKEFCDCVLFKIKDELNFYPNMIVDPGCGNGVWGNSIRTVWGNSSYICGIDIRDVGNLSSYNTVLMNDYLNYDFGELKYDFIIGNPPFSLAHEFLDRSFELQSEGGYFGFLLKLTWLESKKRYDSYFNMLDKKPKYVWISSRRISFTGDRKTNADAYCFVLWQKGYTGKTELDWLYWDYLK